MNDALLGIVSTLISGFLKKRRIKIARDGCALAARLLIVKGDQTTQGATGGHPTLHSKLPKFPPAAAGAVLTPFNTCSGLLSSKPSFGAVRSIVRSGRLSTGAHLVLSPDRFSPQALSRVTVRLLLLYAGVSRALVWIPTARRLETARGKIAALGLSIVQAGHRRAHISRLFMSASRILSLPDAAGRRIGRASVWGLFMQASRPGPGRALADIALPSFSAGRVVGRGIMSRPLRVLSRHSGISRSAPALQPVPFTRPAPPAAERTQEI